MALRLGCRDFRASLFTFCDNAIGCCEADPVTNLKKFVSREYQFVIVDKDWILLGQDFPRWEGFGEIRGPLWIGTPSWSSVKADRRLLCSVRLALGEPLSEHFSESSLLARDAPPNAIVEIDSERKARPKLEADSVPLRVGTAVTIPRPSICFFPESQGREA